MPTLSTLLLRHSVATYSQVDAALMRQAARGGDMLTNLAELIDLDEPKALQALAEAEGLPPMPPGSLPEPEPSALQAIPAAIALSHAILPLKWNGSVLEVVVAGPVPASAKAQLDIDEHSTLNERIALRSRVHVATAKAYGEKPDERMVAVTLRLDGHDVASQRTPTSHLDNDGDRPPRLSRGPTSKMPSGMYRQVSETAIPPTPSLQVPLPSEQPLQQHDNQVASPAAAPPHHPEHKDLSNHKGPLTLQHAKQVLEQTASTSEALRVLFLFSRQFFSYTAVFVVRHGLAEGWDAFGPGAGHDAIRGIGVPLDMPSILAASTKLGAPIFRAPERQGIDALLRTDLKRDAVGQVLVLPIALRGKTIALLWGDDGERDVAASWLGDVLTLPPFVSGAVQRALMRRKNNAPNRTKQAGIPATQIPPSQRKSSTLSGMPSVATQQAGPVLPAPEIPPSFAPTEDTETSTTTRRITQSFEKAAVAEQRELPTENRQEATKNAFPSATSPTQEPASTADTETSSTEDTAQPPPPHDAPPVDSTTAETSSTENTSQPPLPHDKPSADSADSAETPDQLQADTPNDESPEHPPISNDQEAFTNDAPAREVSSHDHPDSPQRPQDTEEANSTAPVAQDEEHGVQDDTTVQENEVSQTNKPAVRTDDDGEPEPAIEDVVRGKDEHPTSDAPAASSTPPDDDGKKITDPDDTGEQTPSALADTVDKGPTIEVGDTDEDVSDALLETLRSSPTPPQTTRKTPHEGTITRGPHKPPASYDTDETTLPSVVINMDDEIDKLLTQLEATDTSPSTAHTIREALLSMGELAYRPVLARFPGKILLEQSPITGLPLPARACGRVLEIASFMVHELTPHLRKLAESDDDLHKSSWALRLLAESGDSSAEPLVRRALIHKDKRMRRAAVDALQRSLGRDPWAGHVHEFIREQLRDRALPIQQRIMLSDALAFVSQNRDMHLLFDTLDTISSDDRAAVEKMLIRWTGRPGSGTTSTWRTWWEAHREEERFSRLLEGLSQADDETATIIATELTRWMSQDIGYRANLSEDDRHALITRCEAWWAEHGGRRAKNRTWEAHESPTKKS